jgi:hypothetical protein
MPEMTPETVAAPAVLPVAPVDFSGLSVDAQIADLNTRLMQIEAKQVEPVSGVLDAKVEKLFTHIFGRSE